MKIEARLIRWDRLRPNAGTDKTWGIYFFRDLEHDHEFKAVGVMANSVRKKGVRLILEGKWELDKYGPKGASQFSFRNHVIMRPAGREGMISFLTTAKHIGKVTATRIWDRWGEDSAKEIISDHQCLVDAKLLNTEQAEEAAKDIACGIDEAQWYSAINTLLSNLSFPKSLPRHVIEKRWGDPVAMISRNPFILLCFAGVGFKKCDALRKKLGLPADMPERYRAAVDYAMEQHQPDVWVTFTGLMAELAELLTLKFKATRNIVLDAIEHDVLTKVTERGDDWVCQTRHGKTEFEMCKHMARLSAPAGRWPGLDNTVFDDLTAHQRKQLDLAFQNGQVAVLMGAAGTGKTFCGGKVINVMQLLGKRVVVCAPTGKAALRIEQSLANAGVNLRATTVHKALLAQRTAEGFRFAIDGETRFLEADVVVVDEMSMMSNHLLLTLLRAIRTGTHVLMLGDPNQLAPVGKGTFLRDWEAWCNESAISEMGLLTEIQRHAGKIIETSKEVYEGVIPDLTSELRPGRVWDKSSNLQYRSEDSDEELQLALLDVIDDIMHGIITDENNKEYHHMREVQVVVAINSNSPCSKDELNLILQRKLNNDAGGDHEHFKYGDKVICLKNNMFNTGLKEDGEYFVANGSIGYVTRSELKRIWVRMDDHPNVELVIPIGAGKGDFDLAYAITCHKMQGSQAPVVITVLGGGSSYMVADRGWFYTAITRAQELSIVLSDDTNIARACRRTHVHERKSFVHRWLRHHIK